MRPCSLEEGYLVMELHERKEPKTVKILLSTIPGLEDIALKDVKLLVGSITSRTSLNPFGVRGYVLLEVPVTQRRRVLDKLFTHARSLEKIFEVLCWHEAYTKELDRVRELLNDFLDESLDVLRRIFSTKYTSFCVVIKKDVDTNFTSKEAASLVGEEISRKVVSIMGYNPPISLDNPCVRFIVEISEKAFALLIDLSFGTSLRERDYRVYYHPAALDGVVAYLMAKLAGAERAARILDPMCGSGTLLIEAAYLNPEAELFGVDINPQHLRGASLNISKAGIEKRVKLMLGDARQLENIFPQNFFDVILVNPPYGIRLRAHLYSLYLDFLKSCKKVLRKEGIIAVITPRVKTLRKAALRSGLKILEEREVTHGGLFLRIFLLSL